MGTSWTLYGTLSGLGFLGASRIMSAARSFEDFEVAPQADDGKKLTI
jgi:hypothetical protein